MADYVYIQTTDTNSNIIYEAGFYDPSQTPMVFVVESTHPDAEAAARRVHFLNGGPLANAVQRNYQAQPTRKINTRTHQN
jgi:hypothetical protein